MASQSLLDPGSVTKWTDAGNTPDKALDLGGLTTGSVACGAMLDLGAGPRPDIYEMEFKVDGFATNPVSGVVVDLFVIQSNDGTLFDGAPTTAPDATTQGTVSAAQVANAMYVASAVTYSTTNTDKLVVRATVRLTSRYVAPVVINRSGVTLLASGDFHYVKLTPIPQEAQ
jgi:hypothetical protein